ncbi:hypothetical protein BOTCAL_0059g00140 [Botryotinia calthae]|uniref:BTB domain-containing protein n=1 Tax=Botryotinia calthae TaxID=38488 RepID=A0A4Y8DA00_9HELO|nr:hypothetical protein BOTCAL_0059g00140 [Botryotinia calthae]
MERTNPFDVLPISPFAKNRSPFYVKFPNEQYPIKYDVENKRVSTKNTFFNDLGLHRTPDLALRLDDCFRIPLQLILRWLQEDHMDVILSELQKREHQPFFDNTSGENAWTNTVIHLCILCENWDFSLAFNAAMDHLLHLRDFSFMAPKQIEAIYRITKAGSILRGLIVDIISSTTPQDTMKRLGSLENSHSDKKFEELLDDLRIREVPKHSLFDSAGNLRIDQLVEYHMKV